MKVIHFHLSSHPGPVSEHAIEYALSLTRDLGAQLAVTNPRVAINTSTHWLMGPTLTGMARDTERRAARVAEATAARLKERAASLGVRVEVEDYVQSWPALPGEDLWRGRASDLCVLPLRAEPEHRLVVEDWLFHLGRPCLILPASFERAYALEKAVVCWDLSRSAARAVGDALPLLRRTKETRILIVRGEKDLPSFELGKPLAAYLEAHGVACAIDEVPMAGGISKTILGHCSKVGADLLVMGAFGHSRTRQFLLGGATKGVLDDATLPLLMSH